MKPFVYRIMFVLSLLTLSFFSSQATDLGLGDIAITGCGSGTSGLPANLRDGIYTAGNWSFTDSSTERFDLSTFCNFTCTAVCTPGVANSISGYVGPPLCQASTQTLSVIGSLNDDQSWVWYTGSCGGTQVATGPNFNVSPTVTTTYYVRAEGSCSGTSGYCVFFTVEIGDIEDPVVTCPGTINVNNDPGLCSAVVNFIATGTDNCGGTVDIAYSQNPGTAFDVGATRVRVTATDDFNNPDTCSFLVIVADNFPPYAICQNITIQLNAGGDASLSPQDVNSGPIDVCGISSLAVSPNSFNCDDVGTTNTVTLTVTDSGSNMATCTASVTISDTVNPCCDIAINSVSQSDVGCPGASDGIITINATCTTCDGIEYSIGNGFQPGNTFTGVAPGNYTLTARDTGDQDCNDTFGTFINPGLDFVPPSIICPSDVTLSADANCQKTIPDLTGGATVSDNCSAPGNISVTQSPTAGTVIGLGTTTITLTAQDEAGLIDSDCSFTITVNDNEAPTINCPSNVTVNNDAGNCSVVVNIPDPTLGDNCPNPTFVYSPTSGSTFNVGTTVVTGTVTDASDNTAQCTVNVTVNDTEAPTFSNCPGNISVSNDAGECGAAVSWTPPTFEDNCEDGATSSSTYDPNDFFEVGTTTVTYSGSDAADNDATDCSFTVTVNDTEVPTFSNCPGNINVFNDEGDCGAIVSWTPPALNDNCPGATFDSSHDPDDFFSVGTTTVTYTGSDDADNDAIDCSFTVSVTDNEKPNISCPANISTGTDVGECGAEVTFTPAIANDNCAVEEIKARYRSVDESNSATSSWTSRVLDPSGFFPVGRYQVQWRAEDIYGNKKTCSHYLDVYDDENPVAVCKDVTVDFNGEEDINLTVSQVWNEAASSDNCGNVSYVGTSPGLSIDCDDLGNTVALAVTIEDEAGNEDQCTSYVSIIGLPCGWAEGPQDGSLNCGNDTSSDYDVDEESFSLTADGCWHDYLESDKAAFVYHELCGDGQLTARLADINTSGYAGLMARESLDPDARRAGVLKNYSTRRVRREYRAEYGGVVTRRPSNRSRVKWLRIVRQGNSIKSYTSTNGSYWRLLYKVTFPDLEDCLYLGMTAYSLSGSKEVEAVFDNVSITSSGSLAGGFGDQTSTPGQSLAYDIAGNIGNGEVDIFPNPANNETQIVLNGFEDKPAQIIIRDQFGRLVRQIDVDSAMGLSETIPVNDLATGIYLVSIIQDQQAVVSKKLVVQQ